MALINTACRKDKQDGVLRRPGWSVAYCMLRRNQKMCNLTLPSNRISWTTQFCQSYMEERQRERGVEAIDGKKNLTCICYEMEEWLWKHFRCAWFSLPGMHKIHFWEHGCKKEEPSITQAKPPIHILSCVFAYSVLPPALCIWGEFRDLWNWISWSYLRSLPSGEKCLLIE